MGTRLAATLAAVALAAAACAEEKGPGDRSLAFGAECVGDEDCQSGLCFEYGEKGPHCTVPCPAAPDTCPAPSSGCNNKGVCKID
jgi:hypothetical protein